MSDTVEGGGGIYLLIVNGNDNVAHLNALFRRIGTAVKLRYHHAAGQTVIKGSGG